MLFLILIFASFLCAEDQITSHRIDLGSKSIPYTACLGSLPTRDRTGKTVGEISYISYCQDGSSSTRPITFAFNGGPGSSSIWLHLGAFGPRRILSPEEGESIAPPYRIQDNLETLLDCTDLVFIDPMGTGFSRTENPEDALPFYEVTGDIESIGNFISDFLSKRNRWNSPIYLAGESYGTLRACGLAEYLQEEKGLYLNGLILISCVLDYDVVKCDNPSSYFLFLPSYMTTAWYHGRYRPDATIEEIAEEARQFAYRSYAPALLNPFSMLPSEKADLYLQLSNITGLPLNVVKKNQGSLQSWDYFTDFFPEEKKRIGRMDSRIVGEYVDGSEDPSMSTISGIFTGAFNQYLLNELNAPPSPYKVFSDSAYSQWHHSPRRWWMPVNLLPSLRKALVVNPTLKIYVGCGYYDLATPFAAAEYYFHHLDLPSSYFSNIEFAYYEGGHMYYLNPSARIKMKQDLSRFYQACP